MSFESKYALFAGIVALRNRGARETVLMQYPDWYALYLSIQVGTEGERGSDKPSLCFNFPILFIEKSRTARVGVPSCRTKSSAALCHLRAKMPFLIHPEGALPPIVLSESYQ